MAFCAAEGWTDFSWGMCAAKVPSKCSSLVSAEGQHIFGGLPSGIIKKRGRSLTVPCVFTFIQCWVGFWLEFAHINPTSWRKRASAGKGLFEHINIFQTLQQENRDFLDDVHSDITERGQSIHVAIGKKQSQTIAIESHRLQIAIDQMTIASGLLLTVIPFFQRHVFIYQGMIITLFLK